MAAHSDLVFEVKNGRAIGIEDPEPQTDEDEYESEWQDDTEEFKACADGWYWQHRRIRDFEPIGEAFGQLRGPFNSQQAAEQDQKANSKQFGVGRLG